MAFGAELINATTAKVLIKAITAAAPRRPLPALRAAAGQLETRTLRRRSDLLRDASCKTSLATTSRSRARFAPRGTAGRCSAGG